MSGSVLYGYYGHHKCATTWVRRLVDKVCQLIGINSATIHSVSQADSDLPKYVEANKIGFLNFTNAAFEHVETLGQIPGIHVIRDPRDIIVSAYFSHLKTHPTDGWEALNAHRQKLNELNKEDGLIEELSYSFSNLKSIGDWNYDRPNIAEMRFEELATNPYDFALHAFRHLGLLDERNTSIRTWLRDGRAVIGRRLRVSALAPATIPSGQLLALVSKMSFSKLADGRKSGEEDTSSHFRKGVAGDWKNHFTRRVEEQFKSHYPDLLQTLGYETDDAWTANSSS